MHQESNQHPMSHRLSRRSFLAAGVAAAAALNTRESQAQDKEETYVTHAKGIRIKPGHWRPHYAWEHIAWVSPAWPSQDYIWMDFPEAIFTSQGLLYLSHINPPIDTVYHDTLPKVAWNVVDEGMSFERVLPNRVAFGGSLMKGSENTVDLELHIHNGSGDALNNITLQTCAFLRGIKEFGDFTRENKFVHTANNGWITMEAARELDGADAPYGVGWRTRGNRVADIPIAVAVSNEADRLIAFTWGKSTLSMVENPGHPCFHADPQFPDLGPGENASVTGKLIFFEGKLEDFDYTKFL